MSENKAGILLINLGSPKKLTKKSVRDYLKVFLSDDYVLDIPKILQQIILRVFILPFRPKNTLEAYEQIWTPEGSPNYQRKVKTILLCYAHPSYQIVSKL